MRIPKRLVLLSLLAAPLLARAADEVPDNRLLTDKFRVSLGGFYAESTTQARLAASNGGVGADVSLEDALGLDSRALIGEAQAYWRFGERWRLDASYFRLARSASRNLTADVTWGDNTYTAGTVVSSNFTVSDLRAAVGYSFFRTKDKEIGVGGGLHMTGFKVGLDAAGVGARSESVTAPLPFFALYANVAFTDRWAFSARSDWLSLAYDKYAGSIRATAFDIVYQPWQHFALGFGMHSLTLRVDVDNPHSQFGARMALQGPAAFASYSF
jgi:hypothetical protein